MRLDDAVNTGSTGDWEVAYSALGVTRSQVHSDRDREVLELLEGYYRLGELERSYKQAKSIEASGALPQLRVQMIDCRDHWLSPYLDYFAPAQPPAGDNPCVRAPRRDINQHATYSHLQ